jgi:hypothetical protein
MTEIQLKILIYPAAIFGSLILNYAVFERLLIPDECYYHSHATNALFDIFYNTSSGSGGHPEPTIFNFIFTLIVGILLARGITRFFINRL